MNIETSTALESLPNRSRFLLRELFRDLDVTKTSVTLTNSSAGSPVSAWYAAAHEKAHERYSSFNTHLGGDIYAFVSRGVDAATSGTSLPTLIEIRGTKSDHPGTAPVVNTKDEIRENVGKALDKLLTIAEDESFQDGMDSNLSIGIVNLITRFPAQAILLLSDRLAAGTVSVFSTVEALLTLGRLTPNPAKEASFALLVSHLTHKSPLVRDAASVALTYTNDTRAISYLRTAIATETVPSLRDDFNSAIDQLTD